MPTAILRTELHVQDHFEKFGLTWYLKPFSDRSLSLSRFFFLEKVDRLVLFYLTESFINGLWYRLEDFPDNINVPLGAPHSAQ